MCTDPVVDTDTLASLDCSTNQSIGWNGDAWVCKSQPIVATLSRLATNNYAYACCSVIELFQTYSPNVHPYTPCNSNSCTIRLVDVLDHNSCATTLTGNQWENSVNIWTTFDEIHLDFLGNLDPYQPLYVNITCVPDFYSGVS